MERGAAAALAYLPHEGRIRSRRALQQVPVQNRTVRHLRRRVVELRVAPILREALRSPGYVHGGRLSRDGLKRISSQEC